MCYPLRRNLTSQPQTAAAASRPRVAAWAWNVECLVVPASLCAWGYTSILRAILTAAIGITTGHLLDVSLLPVLDLVASSC